MSDDAKVAQGPWRAVQQEDGDWEVRAIINSGNHYVLIAFDLTEAVAKKIAAAPDMLEILRRICGSYPGYIPDFVEGAYAAIDKAEGRG